MTKRFCLVLLVVTVACDDEEPSSRPTPAPTWTCTAAEEGNQRCSGTRIQTCLSTEWVTDVDCGDTGEACAAGTFTCVRDTSCDTNGAVQCFLGTVRELCTAGDWVVEEDCADLAQVCELNDGPPATTSCVRESCTAGENGARKCFNDDIVVTCDGAEWGFTEDCSQNVPAEVCDEPAAGFAQCVEPPVSEFGECTGAGQGNCPDGMTCMDWSNVSNYLDVAECITECVGPTDCPGRTCSDLFGWCVTDDGARGDSCGMNGHGCTAPLECTQPNAFGVEVFDCEYPCAASEVNQGQGSCGAGEECLAGPFVELQGGASAWVDCSVGGDTDCQRGQGYFCEEVQIGASVEKACMRYEGWCGTPVATLHDFGQADIDAWISEGTSFKLDNLCGVPGLPQYCKPEGAATANFACESLPYVAVESETPCSSSTDCSWDEGFACVPVSSGDLCAGFLGTCVAFCDDADGNEFTCPAGTTCLEAPDNGMGWPFPHLETDSQGAAVSCPGIGFDDDCNNGTFTGFVCTGFGGGGAPYYCARPKKVCQTN